MKEKEKGKSYSHRVTSNSINDFIQFDCGGIPCRNGVLICIPFTALKTHKRWLWLRLCSFLPHMNIGWSSNKGLWEFYLSVLGVAQLISHHFISVYRNLSPNLCQSHIHTENLLSPSIISIAACIRWDVIRFSAQ